METKLLLLLLCVFGLSKTNILAQNTCCEQIKVISKIEDPMSNSRDFNVKYSLNGDSIRFTFKNTTTDTIYLFKSYMDESLWSSKYLHRINKKGKTYTVSFVPLISNLTVKQSDKLIIGENKVGSKHQLKYDFFVLPPSTYLIWNVSLNSVFRNKNKRLNSVIAFNENKLDKFANYKFKPLTTSKLNEKYHLDFSFGYYKNVQIFCDCTSYYLNEHEFNKQAKSFESVRVKTNIMFPSRTRRRTRNNGE